MKKGKNALTLQFVQKNFWFGSEIVIISDNLVHVKQMFDEIDNYGKDRIMNEQSTKVK